MRIIIANRYFYPDEAATSRVASSLARELARGGYEVHVIASPHLHNDSSCQLPLEEIVDGVHVHRTATSGFGRDRLLGRAADYVTYHLAAGWRMWQLARREDVIINCTDPPLLSVTAMIAAHFAGARRVNWLFDLFPEVAIELGYVARRGLVSSLLMRVRDLSLSTATVNVVPMASMGHYLSGRGIPERNVAIIHSWSEGDSIRPIPPGENALRSSMGLGSRFVVAYAGNLGRAHEFDTILDAALLLRNRNDVLFLFIGAGARRRTVEARAQELELSNVLFLPLQPREKLSETLSAADVHLVSLRPEMEPFVIPSKFYGIAAAGRPTLFVGSPDGEIARIISEANCGESVPIGRADMLAKAICDLADTPALRHSRGKAARQVFERAYDQIHGTQAWCTLLRSLEKAPGEEVHQLRKFDQQTY